LEHKILGFIDYNFILGNGIDHIFGTWYFLGLLWLLAASLTACSATTQYPMLKVRPPGELVCFWSTACDYPLSEPPRSPSS
jgi:hypothetical protein